MPPPISVVLSDYDPKWPELAARYTEGLRTLGPVLLTVHHIGSTSVPGLAAKPVIDLMPLVTSLTGLDRMQNLVEALGYVWHGEHGISGRRYCTLSGVAGKRLAHLHFFEPASPHTERHLAFRDYLRAHAGAAKAYENEKRRAREMHPYNSHAYCDEKGQWIRDMEVKSLLWKSEQVTACDLKTVTI
jgi:GrpB-like predicted nucleotidyltransferase (UPF0157 family)